MTITAEQRGFITPLRSSLFVPAHRDNLIPKALTTGADALIMDLEDACPPAEKANGRRSARQALETLDWSRTKATIRINSLDTNLWQEDVDAIVHPMLYMVRVPKSEDPDAIRGLDAVLTFLESRRGIPQGSIKMSLSLENPIGVINAWEMVNASPRVALMGGGELDYHAEMQSDNRPDRLECLYLYSTVLHVCHSTGVQPMYTIYPAVKDVDGLVEDCKWGRSMGFTGRACLHPIQVEPVNRIFGPSPEKVEWAQRVMAAVKEGREKKYGEILLDGMLIGPPTMIEVKRILEQAGLEFDAAGLLTRGG